jgi:hypothetical protein
MTWGLIARADQGGLGNLTYEIAYHLHPDRILIVEMGPDLARGREDLHRYDHLAAAVYVASYADATICSSASIVPFLAGLDTLLTVETSYDSALYPYCRDRGITTHLYAMPELYRRPTNGPDHVWFPEPIGHDSGLRTRTGGYDILPWPASTDRTTARTWFPPDPAGIDFRALPGRAMLDRNGARATIATWHAYGLAAGGAALQVWDPDPDLERHIETGSYENIVCSFDQGGRADWPELAASADVLVLPRRYGWLSLPIYEAACAGIPIITTALHPQNTWFDFAPELLVQVHPTPNRQRMKGGMVNVWDPMSDQLARAIRHLTDHPEQLGEYGARFRAWAEERSWALLEDRWRTSLGIGPPPATDFFTRPDVEANSSHASWCEQGPNHPGPCR